MGLVQLYRPGGALAERVHYLWSWRSEAVPARYERALPSGALHLIVNLEDDRIRLHEQVELPGTILCGAQAGSFVIVAPPRRAIGAFFKPGGAAEFLDVPAGDLEGRHAPVEALWGRSSLRERLLEQPTVEARFAVLEACLIERMRPRRADRAVSAALRAFEDPQLGSVAEVNARVGRSPKQLIALFRDEVGLTPKAYWRVRRFQAALRALPGARGQGAALAASLGYFDQAHLDREFRHFAGTSPRDYVALARRVPYPNHVPLHG